MSTMNARERMLAAIDHEPIDRIPTDMWATSEVWAKLRKHFGEGANIKALLHLDGFAGEGPKYIGPALPVMPAGESINFWGFRNRKVPHEGGAYDEQFFYPLADATSIDDLDKYNWPKTEWFDYSVMVEPIKEYRKHQAIQVGYMAPFYYHNMLRGLEQSLIDPLAEPEFTHEILRRITDFFYAHHRRMFETCEGLIDVTQVTDDLGSQSGPMISLELYKEFYAPHHKRLIGLCKEFGIRVFHHDDGDCRPFLPTLVDMGINILNPVQWSCPEMDMKGLKKDFGKKICFHGAIENQRILPFGMAEEVRAEVRHCIDALASDKTGYILGPCHNLQVVTPVENIIAMYDECWNYGKMA